MHHRFIILLLCQFLCWAGIGDCSLFAQGASFRGKVEVKSHDLLHDRNRSTIAGVLMQYTGWDRSNFDTIYQTYHICGDTLISEMRGMDPVVLQKSMSIGSFSYLLSSQGKREYIKIPLNKNHSRIGSATGKDWQKNKPGRRISGFRYEYYLRNPDNKVVQLFASVDKSVVYQDQLHIGGPFNNAFHHFGKYDTVIVNDGRTEVFMKYTYQEDAACNCAAHFDDYPVRDLTRKEVDEVMTQLEGMDKDTIIRASDRATFKAAEAVAPSESAPGNHSMDDFKGKYLLVDVWASWCAPCRAEIPYLRELRERYDEDKLAILSISLDSKKDTLKWAEAVISLQMDWTNWIIYDGFQSEFAQEYEIRAIPRYFIIDPDGRIVNDNAPRPSDEALIMLINKLLFSAGKDDD